MRHELKVLRLGARGDGIAETADGLVYTPYVLPGELISVEIDQGRGRGTKILTPSPDRIRPVCPHFGRCGGCALQHWAEGPYGEFKREIIVQALARRGLDGHVAPVWRAPLGSRRRVTLAARRTKSGVLLGYRTRRGHDIVAVESCPIAVPQIVEALPALRALLRPLLSRRDEARLAATSTHNGLDLAIEGIGRSGRELADIVAQCGSDGGIARLSVNGEILAQYRPVQVSFAGTLVPLPTNGFLQTSREAEEEMVRLITKALGHVRRVGDLFAGLGTFTLPLARSMEVDAVDGDEHAVAALFKGVRAASGLKPVTVAHRDLFRDPLRVGELAVLDAIVFDPPRAGAKAQAEELSRSSLKTIIAVSCNPATFSRDARILVDGGYELECIWPIDQFLFSAHVELVAVFRK